MPQLNRGIRRLLILAILFSAIAGSGLWWHHSINVDPVVTFPAPPPLPSPNARDVYLAAAKLQVKSWTDPSTKRTIHTFDMANYIRGGAIILKPGSPDPPPSLAEMKGLIAKNTPALKKVRQGFTYDTGNPSLHLDLSKFDELRNLRDLKNAMMADADVKCATGDWDGAVGRYVDIIHYSTDIGRGLPFSTLMGGTRGLGSDVWSTLDYVSGSQARRAAQRLEKIAGERANLTEILQAEKLWTQALMLELFNEPNWRTEFGGTATVYYNEEQAHDHFMLRFVSKRTAMHGFTRYMDQLITNVNEANPLNTKIPSPPDDPLNRFIVPDCSSLIFRYTRTETLQNMLITSFALRAYKADHGTYPPDLPALAPDYLKAIPADLFSPGPLKYKVTGKSYALYSVGPDGNDDGGTPSADGKQARQDLTSKSTVKYISRDSTGDIVAGVNIY